MAREQKNEPSALPLLAQAMVNQSAGSDDEGRMFMRMLLEDEMKKRAKEKAKADRMAVSAVQAAQDQVRAIAAKRNSCSHRKQNGETRLAGQRLSGTGQLALSCGWCETLFHIPALEGQTELTDRSLIPQPDYIGG